MVNCMCTAACHHLRPCLFVLNWTFIKILQLYLNKNTWLFFQWNPLYDVLKCKILFPGLIISKPSSGMGVTSAVDAAVWSLIVPAGISPKTPLSNQPLAVCRHWVHDRCWYEYNVVSQSRLNPRSLCAYIITNAPMCAKVLLDIMLPFFRYLNSISSRTQLYVWRKMKNIS